MVGEIMSRGSTLPSLKNTLRFCQFLLDCSEEDYQNNLDWVRETRQHRHNIKILMEVLESEDDSMVMDAKSYRRCLQTFGKKFTEKVFRDVKIVKGPVPPIDADKLLANIESKNETLARIEKKMKQPSFFTETPITSFEGALFRRKNGTNGYRSAKKDWPKVATSFAELQQAKIEGELSTWFLELSNNILLSSEFSPAVKAEKLAALTAEYSSLVSGQKGKGK